MSIRIVAISDTHGLHEHVSIPEGDILIHAGDFTKVGALEDVVSFNDFLWRLPHPKKIVVAGNHDLCFEQLPGKSVLLLTNAIYLQDAAVTMYGIKFYGSPWQPWYLNWAFNLPRGQALKEKWDLIPADTDVLITHGPPFFVNDQNFLGEHLGCRDLLTAVEQIKPQLHIFGHVHEGAGTANNLYTTFINASICDAGNHVKNKPQIYDYL